MVHPHRQHDEEGATAPLQPQEAEEIWLVTKNTHKLLQMHNREHSVGLYALPGTATALPTTVRLSKG